MTVILPCCSHWNGNRLIAETPLMHARYDGYPVAPGHALIIPKRHVVDLDELTEPEAIDMHRLIVRVYRHLRATVKPDAYTTGFNDGGAAGRSVDHLHGHVMPRWWGDVADPTGGLRRILYPNIADDPYQPGRRTPPPGLTERGTRQADVDHADGASWTHGTRLGRDHRSVREHLVEDHGVSQGQVDAWSDGAVHGHHDGVHRTTWAYANDLAHPAPGDREYQANGA